MNGVLNEEMQQKYIKVMPQKCIVRKSIIQGILEYNLRSIYVEADKN